MNRVTKGKALVGAINVATLSVGGTDVTASAAELNILDGVTASAAELNILDGVTASAAELNILDGVTSSTAELNIVDGVTATAAELNILDGQCAAAVFTVGAESGGDTINVGIQLNDAAGAAMATRTTLLWYLSSDANGDAIASATSGGIAIGTDGLLVEWTTNVSGMVTSEADGDIDVNIVEAGALTVYLVLVLPTGKLTVSGVITFAG
jgi:hypothetical protein